MPYAQWLDGRAEYRRCTIVDFGVPSPQEMTAILDVLDAALAAGRVVYLHCWGGVGRTGTVVGCYLVRHGMRGEEALAALDACGLTSRMGGLLHRRPWPSVRWCLPGRAEEGYGIIFFMDARCFFRSALHP
jgi:hypothetical protein